MNDYFESITSYYFGKGWLNTTPKKSAVVNNAKVAGNVSILGGSNNRAIIIKNGDTIYLQSYDTLILKADIRTGRVEKLWNDYSATTMKHINAFMSGFNGMTFNKAAWLAFKGV